MAALDYPTPHGCSTFKPPPLDGSMILPEVFDYNGTENPEHTLFRYVQNDQQRNVTWGDARQAFHNVGTIVKEHIGSVVDTSRPVVAVLAVSDSTTYMTVICGIMRAGFIPFPISPRNSAVAVAHLINVTKSKYVLVSSDTAMQGLYNIAREQFPKDSDVKVFNMPTYEQLYGTQSELLPPLENVKIDDAAVILHSSGSTAFPKPITLTFRMMLQAGLTPYFGEINLSNEILSSHAVPMFHLMGVVQIPFTSISGLTIAVFPPQVPPVLPTPDRVFTDAIATGSSLVFCAPLFLEAWFRNPEYVPLLKDFKVVIFAGGPLDPAVGDELVKQGVNLAALYGSTESGPLTVFLPKKPAPEGWSFWRISPHVTPALVPWEGQDGVYHLVVKRTPTHTPAIINAEIDGQPALDMNDLVILHPDNPKLFQVYGRADDQIMHSTGEKTNPGPLEKIVNNDPNVQASIMFGRTRFNAGVILMPAPSVKVEVSNEEEVASFRNKVWPTIEKANSYAPSHSRIFKEMIVVADPAKPFELTPKGTLRRPRILQAYEAEIEKTYEDFKASTQEHITAPQTWSLFECLELVRCTIKGVMNVDINDTDDIFQKGCDSLQATWIKNTLLRTFPSRVDARKFSSNFVYAHPSIEKLSQFLVEVCSEAVPGFDSASILAKKCEEMQRLVEKYSSDLPSFSGTDEPNNEVVLLTGTTGGLGAHVLEHLLRLPTVSKVYALNRQGAQTTLSRHEAVFAERGLDIAVLKSPKLFLLDADLPSEHLALDATTYETLKREITCIMHIGWRVDFNVSLSSMEPLLKGTRNLVDLALGSTHRAPPQFVFISSQSVFANWKIGMADEARITDPRIAALSGYSESKWCAEEILYRISTTSPMHAVSVRVGQVSGGRNGYWTVQEWFPTLVKSSQSLGSLPDMHGPVSWVPLDVAAAALVEMRTSCQAFMHLVHPKTCYIENVMSALSDELGLPLVPCKDWLESVHKKNENFGANVTKVPALRLIDFFQEKLVDYFPDGLEALGFPRLSTDLACQQSSSLRALDERSNGKAAVLSWVRSWRSRQFLE
ncbi:hypothetical protein D9758_009087 [Tetrapyrgos nigripes]|uniref:Acetyl-CoA synthetase-like protein n=1 Tax=Tetrapyrgos nigripes TaxID=182062 RepID=A0A8H5LL14_9AGAR|nr:hypothetical protein D9758_009087 [Tetrapyrgos nigripes]